MSAEQLLAHFGRLSEAPGALPRLRRFILDLAVRGKLVPQEPNDTPSTELLGATCQASSSSRSARSSWLPQTIEPGQIPFAVPDSWRWVRLSQIAILENGDRSKNYPSRDQFIATGVPFINAGHLQGGRIALDKMNYITREHFNKLRSGKVRRDDILFCLRGSLGKLGLVHELEGAIASSLVIVRLLDRAFLAFILIYFDSSLAKRMVERFDNGTAQPNLSGADLGQFLIPIPPLPEQNRIAAKVNGLMAVCNRLEQAQAERERRRDRLTVASTNPPGRHEPHGSYGGFYVRHLSSLAQRRIDIHRVRITTRALAVRGHLVRQQATDGPVPNALNRLDIQVERAATPFVIPSSWAWVTVGSVAESRLGKMLDRARNRGRPKRYLRNVNVRWFDFDLSDLFEMRFEEDELSEFTLRKGDVLVCEGGEPGRAAVWDQREEEIYFQKAIHRIRFGQLVDPRFFVNVLREAFDSGRLHTYYTGTGIKHLTGKGLERFVFPLPPLPEQCRIVAKLDAVNHICDRWETQLVLRNMLSRRVLESVLHKALSAD